MKILISGTSGLIGSALLSYLLEHGHQVVKLVRTSQGRQDEIVWDWTKGMPSLDKLEGFDAVIHLAGENIASGRWTAAKKELIRNSRVVSTVLLANALADLHHPPKVYLNASAVGYYGSRGDEILTEQSSRGTGFLAEVCDDWEKAAAPAIEKGIRVGFLRFGAVLSSKGGALKQLLTPFKLGLGGIMGTGNQYFSWIAIDDLVSSIVEILSNESYQGPINIVSPVPVTNQEFTKTLSLLLHRPSFMRMPAFMAKIIFGEMADEVLLASTRAVPEVLIDGGFEFAYPHLEWALRHILMKIPE